MVKKIAITTDEAQKVYQQLINDQDIVDFQNMTPNQVDQWIEDKLKTTSPVELRALLKILTKAVLMLYLKDKRTSPP